MRKLLSLVAVCALFVVPALHATPITGQFSVTGSSIQDTGTQLIFVPNSILTGSAPTLTGSFPGLLTPFESGTISSPINYAAYVPNSASLVFGSGSNLLTFSLMTITVDNSNPAFGLFTGTGLITTAVAGYDPTLANLFFSTQADGIVTFSATAAAIPSAVPEPSSLLLLSTGLLGAAGALKRKLS
jgi:hypothetical protein